MPRKLPWMQKDRSSTTITHPKNANNATSKPLKRQRVDESTSDDSAEETGRTSSKHKSRTRTNSTSPPPEAPFERFMDEGMENDDKYRMVEDEFLTTAQKWTVHLHAAEYKRQEKIAKAHNAETISSISRPVTDRMPDQTRRRVEGVARSKAQRSAIVGLLKKNVAAGDTDSDEDGLPYVGTTLHGLMDSPRRKAAALSKVGSIKATTRAAAGFSAHSKKTSGQRIASNSPLSRAKPQPAHGPKPDASTASSDEDDDLDAPIPAPKLEKFDQICIRNSTSAMNSSTTISSSMTQSSESIQRSSFVPAKVAVVAVGRELLRPSLTDFEPPHALADVSARRARREQARLAKEKKEKEEQKKKKLDVIPTFL